jgi:hypothetical protein
MRWKQIFLLLLPPLTSCVNVASYVAHLQPPARYNHSYDGPVVEYLMPLAEVRELCMSRGASARGVACAWVDDGTCYLAIPSDGHAPVSVYRRHETAHCNGWAANHPQDE